MQTLLNLLLRLVLLAAGLVFAASLLVAVLGLLAVWALRYGWARLTGRPAAPFVFRGVDPRAGFGRVWQAGQGRSPARSPRGIADVTDVVAKEPRG